MFPEHSERIFTLPNLVTLVRLLLIPAFVLAVFREENRLALGLFVAAGVSDGVDGLLARLLKQRSKLGAFLDPVADKLLLSIAFLVLAIIGDIPWWIALLVLARDVLILTSSGVVLIGGRWREIPPTLLGKSCTVIQILTIVCLLVARAYGQAGFRRAGELMLWATTVIVVVTGVQYMLRSCRVIAEMARAKR